MRRHQSALAIIVVVAGLLVLPGVAPRAPSRPAERTLTGAVPALRPARTFAVPSDEVVRAASALARGLAEQAGIGELTPWLRAAIDRVTTIVALVARWTAPLEAGRELRAAPTVKT